jgi:hypothetical protein
MSGVSHARRERRQHELERNFVRMPHRATPPPKRNRSSIELPFHGISFRFIGRHRAAVYHQLDGSIEVASACTCPVHFSSGIWGWPDFEEMRVERSADCPIDEHRIESLNLERSA